MVGVVACLKAAEIAWFPRWQPGTPLRPGYLAASILTDLMLAAGFVLALSASPRAERRFLRLTARVWESRFGGAFFRLAGLGRAPRARAAGASDPAEAAGADAVPPAVAARVPELSATLRQLAEVHAGLGARETDIARAVAAAGVVAGVAPGAGADAPPHSTAGLATRRDALLVDMGVALAAARARRTAVAAARENVRVQLLRIGAGVGTPDDLAAELDTARAVLADVAATWPEAGWGATPARARGTRQRQTS